MKRRLYQPILLCVFISLIAFDGFRLCAQAAIVPLDMTDVVSADILRTDVATGVLATITINLNASGSPPNGIFKTNFNIDAVEVAQFKAGTQLEKDALIKKYCRLAVANYLAYKATVIPPAVTVQGSVNKVKSAFSDPSDVNP